MTPADPNVIASDPTTTPAPIPASPTVDLLAEPTHEEWNRYHEDLISGQLNDVYVPANHYFAYYGGKIVDYDPDFQVLQHRAAAKIGVHGARLVIRFHGDPAINM